MSKFVVGLRGGIGTGKTMVSDLFAARGIEIADADISARRVVEPGKPAFNAIVAHFGNAIVQPDGRLDRAALRARVFADEQERRFLESQTQRPIIEDLINQVNKATSPYAILVLSTGIGKTPLMNRLLVVDAPVALQIERVMKRDNNTREQVKAILDAQPSREVRIRDADDLIVNAGAPADIKEEVEALHKQYLYMAEETMSYG